MTYRKTFYSKTKIDKQMVIFFFFIFAREIAKMLNLFAKDSTFLEIDNPDHVIAYMLLLARPVVQTQKRLVDFSHA